MFIDKHLFLKSYHQVKLKLDAICQMAADMNVEEFMQLYESLKQQVEQPERKAYLSNKEQDNIKRNLIEDMINDSPSMGWIAEVNQAEQEDMINNGQIDMDYYNPE
tara:strand:- start:10376 stop:10693 length:318 start_codon:yes stop_codon:yes gene_type:complete